MAVPGLTPRSPVTDEAPVQVTVEAPRTANCAAVPSEAAAEDALMTADARTLVGSSGSSESGLQAAAKTSAASGATRTSREERGCRRVIRFIGDTWILP